MTAYRGRRKPKVVFTICNYCVPVANLFPPTFDVSQLEQSEQKVVDAFVKQLDASWYVVPSIPIVYGGRDAEIDLVLASRDHGVFVVEVKGGLITHDGAIWKSYGHVIKNPFQQVTKAKYALMKRLEKQKKIRNTFDYQHIVAFPDIVDFPEDGAGLDAPRKIIFTRTELLAPQKYLTRLVTSKKFSSTEELNTLLKALKPEIAEIQVNGNYITGASQRIEAASVNELGILFGLDENKRIYLRGRAGTGKTFLAHNWAKRSLRRGERTLLMCYNKALAAELKGNLEDFAARLDPPNLFVAGSFHELINSFLGEQKVEIPNPMPPDFWQRAHAEALIKNIDSITDRFDTIVIDEGQDFQPSWYSAIELLLADKESGRLFVTYDEEQSIFAAPPQVPHDAVMFRLENNVRSTNNIAKIAKRFGGARVPKTAPLGPKVDIYEVGGKKERAKKIIEALKKITEELDIPLSQILVLVPHNNDIKELTAEPLGDFSLVPFDKREEDTIACATMHATKGLERLAVIVASLDDDVDPQVTYVGLTRASVYLSVIGSEKFIASISPNQPQTK